ncbi:helix-turn-helix transcriptional regulator [Rhodocytophaga rosea]|uniref:Helix-turn-helix transcriptional regulator n=1 Tax=Rhodocytophaga rosea TaxID=2704465 RepID=A0A6C0GG34_9BACT|nr:helix-turn-helix transcriptional regulator [Rhodocytophaga rosea]QHT66640.1 helix-turn-helix transcriptional regulator [Rhodocytophaga rosea]
MNTNFYIPPSAHLQDVIHSIWQVEQITSFQTEYIIPKGVIEVIFNFSSGVPIPAQLQGKQYTLSQCFINGFNTAPVQLQLPEHHVFFGVVFQPMAIKKIFKTPASEFSDIAVDVTGLDPSFHSLWHQLAEQDHFNNRVAVLCQWMERKLFDWQPQEKLINQFLYASNQHDLPVKVLADTICYSPRHLSRKLVETTGMNTEEILLYKKYLHALHLMHHTNLSLTEISYQSHFSDQSHFIKSFKAYTHMTPGEYKQNKGLVKGHLYEDVR